MAIRREGGWLTNSQPARDQHLPPAGILFDAGQLAPPLVPTITLGEPGPRLCPRLWSAILESLTVLADEGSQDKKAVGSKFLAVLPKKLRHSLLYEVERTGRQGGAPRDWQDSCLKSQHPAPS